MNKVHLVLVVDVDLAGSEWAKALVAPVSPFVVERSHQQVVEVEKTVAVEKVMIVVVDHVHEVGRSGTGGGSENCDGDCCGSCCPCCSGTLGIAEEIAIGVGGNCSAEGSDM